jgi:hypothetical protein
VYGPGDDEEEYAELYYPGSRWAQTILMDRIQNGFGGTRPFWLCPCCSKRVRYLHFKGNCFMCRECAGLNYRSQQATKNSTYYFRAGMQYARRRFDVSAELCEFDFTEFVPDRPKGMHLQTYTRRLKRFSRYRDRHAELLLAQMAHILGNMIPWGDFLTHESIDSDACTM